MKKNLQFFFFFFIMLLTTSKVEAVTVAKTMANQNQEMASEKFATSPFQNQGIATGKKHGFLERVGAKIIQKKLNKALSSAKAGGGSGGNTLSLLSCIFGGAGLLLLLVGGGLALLLGLAGIVLGIIGLKKEDSKAMAIIGIVCGGLVILLALLVLFVIAATVI